MGRRQPHHKCVACVWFDPQIAGNPLTTVDLWIEHGLNTANLGSLWLAPSQRAYGELRASFAKTEALVDAIRERYAKNRARMHKMAAMLERISGAYAALQQSYDEFAQTSSAASDRLMDREAYQRSLVDDDAQTSHPLFSHAPCQTDLSWVHGVLHNYTAVEARASGASELDEAMAAGQASAGCFFLCCCCSSSSSSSSASSSSASSSSASSASSASSSSVSRFSRPESVLRRRACF